MINRQTAHLTPIGGLVECISHYLVATRLTIKKRYTVISISHEHGIGANNTLLTIKSDDGIIRAFYCWRFNMVEERN